MPSSQIIAIAMMQRHISMAITSTTWAHHGVRRTRSAGCERNVRARLDSVSTFDVFATLLEDDPIATIAPFKAGESDVWSGHSFVDVEASTKRS